MKLSTKQLNENEGAMASMLLKAIGDFERISDHTVNILEIHSEVSCIFISSIIEYCNERKNIR